MRGSFQEQFPHPVYTAHNANRNTTPLRCHLTGYLAKEVNRWKNLEVREAVVPSTGKRRSRWALCRSQCAIHRGKAEGLCRVV